MKVLVYYGIWGDKKREREKKEKGNDFYLNFVLFSNYI